MVVETKSDKENILTMLFQKSVSVFFVFENTGNIFVSRVFVYLCLRVCLVFIFVDMHTDLAELVPISHLHTQQT